MPNNKVRRNTRQIRYNNFAWMLYYRLVYLLLHRLLRFYADQYSLTEHQIFENTMQPIKLLVFRQT